MACETEDGLCRCGNCNQFTESMNSPHSRNVEILMKSAGMEASSRGLEEPIWIVCTGKQFTERRVPKIDGADKKCIIVS